MVATEAQWQSVSGSIGIGTSGYVMVMYMRALTFAVLSAACAALAIYQKNRDNLIATWQSADVPDETVEAGPIAGEGTRSSRPGPFQRRHG
jgi:hypothetical protein